MNSTVAILSADTTPTTPIPPQKKILCSLKERGCSLLRGLGSNEPEYWTVIQPSQSPSSPHQRLSDFVFDWQVMKSVMDDQTLRFCRQLPEDQVEYGECDDR